MKQTPNAQLSTSNTEPSAQSTLGMGRSALDVGRFLWRILDFALAGCFHLRRSAEGNRSGPVRQRHRQLQTSAVASQCRARILSSVGGNFLCARPCVSPFLSWRAVDLDRVNRGLHARDDCRKSSRTRHHLRLFRSRQPTLEFPIAPHNQSRNSQRTTFAFFQSYVRK